MILRFVVCIRSNVNLSAPGCNNTLRHHSFLLNAQNENQPLFLNVSDKSQNFALGKALKVFSSHQSQGNSMVLLFIVLL